MVCLQCEKGTIIFCWWYVVLRRQWNTTYIRICKKECLNIKNGITLSKIEKKIKVLLTALRALERYYLLVDVVVLTPAVLVYIIISIRYNTINGCICPKYVYISLLMLYLQLCNIEIIIITSWHERKPKYTKKWPNIT